jgi:hypothetical protein
VKNSREDFWRHGIKQLMLSSVTSQHSLSKKPCIFQEPGLQPSIVLWQPHAGLLLLFVVRVTPANSSPLGALRFVPHVNRTLNRHDPAFLMRPESTSKAHFSAGLAGSTSTKSLGVETSLLGHIRSITQFLVHVTSTAVASSDCSRLA